MQIVVNPVEPVTEFGVPRAFPRYQIYGAHAKLPPFVGGEGQGRAVGRGQKLGVLITLLELHLHPIDH